MDYLLIGASAACVSAAHTIAKRDPAEQITLVAEQEHPANNTCAIKYVLDGSKNKEDIFLPLPAGATLYTHHKIISLNPERKSVTTHTGKEFFYHRLIIGVGTKPVIPAVFQPYLGQGVFAYHTLDDVARIISFLKKNEDVPLHVMVIGGGLSGVEAAIALRIRGLRVSLIEKSMRIVAHEDSATQHALSDLVAAHHIDVYCGSAVERVQRQQKVFVLETEQGLHTADMIVVAVGCSADNAWMSSAVERDSQGYITRVQEEYAGDVTVIGDCLAAPRVRNGWARALMQGKNIRIC